MNIAFPQNTPYIQPTTRTNHHQQQSSNHQSEMLLLRIQDLQKQLTSLTNLLAEDGGFQQAYHLLQQQNDELRSNLTQRNSPAELMELQAENRLLKQNLLKQNEEMQQLYQRYQSQKNSNSRLQQRGRSQHLEGKVQQLNDEISNLLIKIQQQIEENNELITNQQQMSAQFQPLMHSLREAEQRMKELEVQNQILKQEIRNVEQLSITQQKQLQDRYIQQLQQAQHEIEQLKANKGPPQTVQITSKNSRISEDLFAIEQQLASTRCQLASRNEQLLWQKENEANLRRKWEQRMSADEKQIIILNEEIGKLRIRLRQQQSKNSEYQFVIEQQQKDRDRLNFYKNSYAQSQKLRSTITHLEVQKQQLQSIVQKLKNEFYEQRRYQARQNPYAHEKIQRNNKFLQQQTQQELVLCKKLNKELKSSISKYEQDYRQIRKNYQKLLEQKVQLQQIIHQNQFQLEKHKAIYQQLIIKYNQTSSLYQQLEAKVYLLEKEKNRLEPLYDKENSQLVYLENSALKQEIKSLKNQLIINQSSSTAELEHRREIADLKRRERESAQELEAYRQKYLQQLQKSKIDKANKQQLFDFQDKLRRVNRMLNEKQREVDRLKQRENELLHQLDQNYAKCKLQFDTFAIKHHPEVKKLQGQVLSAQRQIMQNELAFKQQLTRYEDQLKSYSMENQHHREKIDQLLLQVNKQRNNIDYSRVNRSLQLSQLAEMQLRRQIQHQKSVINELQRKLEDKFHNSQSNHLEKQNLKVENQSMQKRLQQYDAKMRSIERIMNKVQPNTNHQEDLILRIVNYIQKITANIQSSSIIETSNVKETKMEQSRYEQLLRKKVQVAEHFRNSEKYLNDSKESTQPQRFGILRRLRENLAV